MTDRRTSDELTRRALRLATIGEKWEMVLVNGNFRDSNGYYYVRKLGGSDNGATSIRNRPIALPCRNNLIEGDGRVVNVITDFNGKREIIGNDLEDLKQAQVNTTQLNQASRVTRYRTFELLSNLQSFPNGQDGKVIIHPGRYEKSTGKVGIYQGETEFDILTSYKPATAGKQHIVALWIDEETGQTAVSTSNEFDPSLDLQNNPTIAETYMNQVMDNAPYRRVGITSYLVNEDDTALTEENKFHDLRPIVRGYAPQIGYPDPVAYEWVVPKQHTVLVKSGLKIDTSGTIKLNSGSTVWMI